MTREIGLRNALFICWMCSAATAAAQEGTARVAAGEPRVHLSHPIARMVVERGVLGAARRLNRPSCQRIFDDFGEAAASDLREGLTVLSAAEYLVQRISFVDGQDTPRCLRPDAPAAFTRVGRTVVYICTARFERRFRTNPSAWDVLIIHELLHTLGLGENPPSSAEITRRVNKRCGGR